jgi:hypothetical protein
METRSLYKSELKDEFEKIKAIDIVSDEHRKVVSDISQLTDRLVKLEEVETEKKKLHIEEQRIGFELVRIEAEKEKAAIEQRKLDIEEQKLDMEERKLDDERKDRLIKNVIAGLGVAIPAGITLTGMVLMFLFEEKGTITSKAGSKIVDRIFRAK